MIIERGEQGPWEWSANRSSQDRTKRHIRSQTQFKGDLRYYILPVLVFRFADGDRG
jgi:hypothetical protein